MSGLLATAHQGWFLGPIAKFLGWILNAIFNFMDMAFNSQNIGLSIILFTVVIYMLMYPLTYKQQKFSKMSAKMNPEIKAVQAKYAGKRDQASMMAMNEETKAVYEKYGVSPSGSCVQLLIQMPILFALYRVIANVPAYINGVKSVFMPLVDKIMVTEGAASTVAALGHVKKIPESTNAVVDILNKFTPKNWDALAAEYTDLAPIVAETKNKLNEMNNFLGINIGISPSDLMKAGVVIAILIPVLAAVTQFLNVKLMPQAATQNTDKDDPMAKSMGTMNMIMPLMSAVFCFTLPSGMGLYWIASSVVRSVQQIFLNRHFDKMNLDDLIKKNLEKVNEKRAKQGLPPQRLNEKAIRAAQVKPVDETKKAAKMAETQEKIKKSTEYYSKDAKPGSIASKANMVKKFDEKNMKNTKK